MIASFWLAYRKDHTILWENLTFYGNKCCGGPQTLADYPESSIYPADPIQSLKPFDTGVATTDGSGCGPETGVGGIQSFVVACGTLVGAGQCAVVMNTTQDEVAFGNWLTHRYTHSMTLGTGPKDGADVLTAGCGNQQCPTSAINPLGASFGPK